jgi:ferredoxin
MSGNREKTCAANGKRAFVDQEICIGCTLCTTLAPRTFSMEENFKAQANLEHEDSVEAIDSAIASCPVQCISWVEADK